MQWQSELHGEPSILAVGAEQNSGHRYEFSQQQLKHSVNSGRECGLYSTYSTLYTLCSGVVPLLF